VVDRFGFAPQRHLKVLWRAESCAWEKLRAAVGQNGLACRISRERRMARPSLHILWVGEVSGWILGASSAGLSAATTAAAQRPKGAGVQCVAVAAEAVAAMIVELRGTKCS